MRFIELIEDLSKLSSLHEGDFSAMAKMVAREGARWLEVERVNAWLILPDGSGLANEVAYRASKDEFYQEPTLNAKDFPTYFKLIFKDDIFMSSDAQSDPIFSELVQPYLKPFDIRSMIDVPFRCMGELSGMLCFEQTGKKKEWSEQDQSFAQALAQLLSLSLEAKQRKEIQLKLESSLAEKEVLIAELSHRVKNNMAIMLGLIRAEASKCEDPEGLKLFENIIDKVYSISEVQVQLYQAKSYDEIQLDEYLDNLVRRIAVTYGHYLGVKVDKRLDAVQLNVTKAIPCGLIINEALTNAFKYAFGNGGDHELDICMRKGEEGSVNITVKDNGIGFGIEDYGNGSGITLMQDLAEQIDGHLDVKTGEKGTTVSLSFQRQD